MYPARRSGVKLRRRRAALAVIAAASLAGPASNLVLVLLSLIAIRIGVFAGVFYSPEHASFGHLVGAAPGLWTALGFIISVCFSLNLVLACLNRQRWMKNIISSETFWLDRNGRRVKARKAA